MDKNNVKEIEETEKAEKQAKHIRKIYSENALKNLSICIGILIFSSISYIVAIAVDNNFDFGFIFELITFASILIAKNHIENNNFDSAKIFIVIAMIPVGWLIIYDFINLIANIQEVIEEVILYFVTFDWYFYSLTPYLVDVTLLLIILFLYFSYNSLKIADGSKQVISYRDRFYDEL